MKNEYENKVYILNSDVERLRNALSQKNEENAKLALRINELSNLENVRKDLESRIALMNNDSARLQDQIRRLSEENMQLQNRLASLRDVEAGRI